MHHYGISLRNCVVIGSYGKVEPCVFFFNVIPYIKYLNDVERKIHKLQRNNVKALEQKHDFADAGAHIDDRSQIRKDVILAFNLH